MFLRQHFEEGAGPAPMAEGRDEPAFLRETQEHVLRDGGMKQ